MKIYDTTLRDGTQSKDVDLTVRDKLKFVEILDKFGIDYIELGWPSSNPKDMECFIQARDLKLDHAKIVAFGSTRRKGISADEDLNLRGILDSQASYAAIFGKTWIEHIEKQLVSTPEENLEAIRDSIAYLTKNKISVFYDAEHYFDGFKDNPAYALDCLAAAADAKAACLVLCDTNGGCLPNEVVDIVKITRKEMKTRNIKIPLGIHCHNDSGCAVANTMIVAKHMDQIQGTINGVGERTGNADLCSILPGLMLKKGYKLPVKLKDLKKVSDTLYNLANMRPRSGQPYLGSNAFAHKGGIHVDALTKGATYEHIKPELVGNKQEIVISDLSGTATVVKIARKEGIDVDKKDPRVRKMLDEIKQMEKRGYNIRTLKAEHSLLCSRFFGSQKSMFRIHDFKIMSAQRSGLEYSECVIVGTVDGKDREVVCPVKGSGGGPVDAAYKALRKMIATNHKDIEKVKLKNYKVMIAEDLGAESSVRVYIEFGSNGTEWATVGVNTNILKASLEAIEKGFRYYLLSKS